MNSKRQILNDERRTTNALGAAFTLVELMVVVAIIAMLAGMMAMYIRDGRDRARSTYCRNNLRQFGVAISKYESDWNGYFIRPNTAVGYRGGATGIDSGGAILRSIGAGSDLMTEDSLTAYEGRMQGVVGESFGNAYWYDTYQGFLNNYVRSGLGDRDVTYCPEVDLTIFKTNSSSFKGRYVHPNEGYIEDYVGKLTTYAINGDAVGEKREELKDDVMAFMDWNAVEGFWASVSWGNLVGCQTSVWYMAKESVGLGVRNTVYKDCGAGATRPKKKNPSYLTEIGYHHRSGTNRIANYVAMDGHVASISSNAPQEEFRRLFQGN